MRGKLCCTGCCKLCWIFHPLVPSRVAGSIARQDLVAQPGRLMHGLVRRLVRRGLVRHLPARGRWGGCMHGRLYRLLHRRLCPWTYLHLSIDVWLESERRSPTPACCLVGLVGMERYAVVAQRVISARGRRGGCMAVFAPAVFAPSLPHRSSKTCTCSAPRRKALPSSRTIIREPHLLRAAQRGRSRPPRRSALPEARS